MNIEFTQEQIDLLTEVIGDAQVAISDKQCALDDLLEVIDPSETRIDL